MSYRRSRARRSFEAQLDLALSELTPLYKVAISKGGGGGSRVLAAYYVLAFAQLEVYVREVVEDSLAAVTTLRPSFDKWPDLMLGYLLHRTEGLGEEYRRFAISEDEGAILAQVARTARKIGSWVGGVGVPTPVDVAVFLDKKKYPSPKNLPQLLRRLGVAHTWAIVGAAGKIDGKMVLTSLNDLRTDIVHDGKVPPGFGLSDFRERLFQMRQFVAALDRGISTHFCGSVMTRSYWNGAMV